VLQNCLTITTSTSAYTYVKGTYTQTSAGYVYDVIIDGKDTTVTVSYNGLTAHTLYTKIIDNGDGTATALNNSVKAAALADNAKYTSIQYVGGLLKLTDAATAATAPAVGANVPVYTFDTTDDTVAVTKASSLTTAVTGKTAVLSYAADGATISAIFIY
jgi:hypothetical protein